MPSDAHSLQALDEEDTKIEIIGRSSFISNEVNLILELSALDITDLKGDMSSSNNNAYSINMADYGDPNAQGVTPANSGRTTSVPG